MTDQEIIKKYNDFVQIEKIAREYVYQDTLKAKQNGYKPIKLKTARLYVENVILNHLKIGGKNENL